MDTKIIIVTLELEVPTDFIEALDVVLQDALMEHGVDILNYSIEEEEE
jgi:hypothetical protein